MEKNQVKLLNDLAKKIKAEKRNKEESLAALVAAKILTKKGNFTQHYSTLKKVVKIAE